PDLAANFGAPGTGAAALRLELPQLERELGGVDHGSHPTALEAHPFHCVERLDPAARLRGHGDFDCLEVSVGIGCGLTPTTWEERRKRQDREQEGTGVAHHCTSHPTSVRNRARASASSIVCVA